MATLPGCVSDSVNSRRELVRARGVSLTLVATNRAAITAAKAKTSHSARHVHVTIKSGAASSASVPPEGMYALQRPSALARSDAVAAMVLIRPGADTAKRM